MWHAYLFRLFYRIWCLRFVVVDSTLMHNQCCTPNGGDYADPTAVTIAEIATPRQKLAAAEARAPRRWPAQRDRRGPAVRVVDVAHSNVRRSA